MAKRWYNKVPWWGWVLVALAIGGIGYLKFAYIF